MTEDRDDLGEIYRGYAQRNAATGRWSRENPGNAFILEERDRVLMDVLSRRGVGDGSDLDALDVGCGSSTLLPQGFRPRSRVGIDILYERLAPALHAGTLDGVACADGAHMPFGDDTFDLVVLYTVLSSVRDPGLRARIGEDVTRVLKPGGHVIWYDMRVPNPANRNIVAIDRKEISRILPSLDQDLRPTTLVPQLARRLGDRPGVYRGLSSLRFTRSHLVGVLGKRH